MKEPKTAKSPGANSSLREPHAVAANMRSDQILVSFVFTNSTRSVTTTLNLVTLYQDVSHAALLQRSHVRSVVDVRRVDAVVSPMSAQEKGFLATWLSIVEPRGYFNK